MPATWQVVGPGAQDGAVEPEDWPKPPIEWEADVVLRDGTCLLYTSDAADE